MGMFERNEGTVVANRHELHARQLSERLDRWDDDHGATAVAFQFGGALCRRAQPAALHHGDDRPPQIHVDRAETRDHILGQRYRHRP